MTQSPSSLRSRVPVLLAVLGLLLTGPTRAASACTTGCNEMSTDEGYCWTACCANCHCCP